MAMAVAGAGVEAVAVAEAVPPTPPKLFVQTLFPTLQHQPPSLPLSLLQSASSWRLPLIQLSHLHMPIWACPPAHARWLPLAMRTHCCWSMAGGIRGNDAAANPAGPLCLCLSWPFILDEHVAYGHCASCPHACNTDSSLLEHSQGYVTGLQFAAMSLDKMQARQLKIETESTSQLKQQRSCFVDNSQEQPQQAQIPHACSSALISTGSACMCICTGIMDAKSAWWQVPH